MSSATVSLFSNVGKKVSDYELSSALLDTKVSPRLLHQVITGYRNNLRSGTSSTKTRAEVSGGGRKPWKQKGTGNARSGSNRSPLWRKGGIIFGPKPRSYRYTLSQAQRNEAFRVGFGYQVGNNALFVVQEWPNADGKTSKAIQFLKALKIEGSSILVLESVNDQWAKAVRNIPFIRLVDVNSLNANHLLSARNLVFTSASIKALENRLARN